jgi:hypothetical protein
VKTGRSSAAVATFKRTLYANTARSRRTFVHLKAAYDHDDIRAIAESFIASRSPFAHYFVPTAFPTSYTEYRRRKSTLPYFSIPVELRWATAILPLFAQKLQLFVDLRSTFENAFITGEYDAARSALDTCERELGVSLWLLEQRCLLESYSRGYEASIAIAAGVASEKHHWLLRYFATLFSTRADTKLAVEDFENKVDRSVGVHDRKRYYSQFAAYVTFKVSRENADVTTHADYIMGAEASAPLVDRYDTLVRLLVELTRKRALAPEDALTHVNSIVAAISDPVLLALDAFLRRKPPDISSQHDARFIDVLDAYTLNDYHAATERGLPLWLERPTYFPLYEILSKAFAADGRTWRDSTTNVAVADIVGARLIEAWGGGRPADLARAELARIAVQLPRTNLAFGLRWFCKQQEEWQDNKPELNATIAVSELANPRIAWQLGSVDARREYLQQLAGVFSNSVVVQFEQSVSADAQSAALDARIPQSRQLWHRARSLMFDEEWHAAVQHLSRIDVGEVPTKLRPLTARRLSRARFDCFFALADWIKCADVVVQAAIDDPGSGRVLPTRRLVDVVERGEGAELFDSINLPLLYAIVAVKQKEIYPAYDRFMRSIGASKPSELLGLADRFSKPRLLFFLARVCVPKVLARSPAFESSEEVSNERIRICQFLAKEQPARSERYLAEINELTQQLAIRRGVRQVESSKIFVDVNALKKVGRSRWRHAFDRLVDVVASRTVSELAVIDTTEIVVINLKAGTEQTGDEEGSALNIETVPLQLVTVSYAQFKDLFLSIRDQFVSSNEFGLNSYLSVRIRHGTIEGQVRSSFEAADLLCQQSSAAGGYLPNRYWDERLATASAAVRDELQKRLQSFSEVVDSIVTRLKTDLIRIRTGKGDAGLFDYTFSDTELIELFRERFRSIRDYEQFVDAALDVLWARTHRNLEAIRKYISGPLKNEAYDALVELQERAKELLPRAVGIEFQNTTISCLTGFQNDFQRMADWFNVSGHTTIQQFSLKEVVDVCTEVISNTHPNVRFVPDVQAPTTPAFAGTYFPALSDIIRTLMDNAIKHSGLNGALSVKIRADVLGDTLTFSMANNLSPERRESDPVSFLREYHRTSSESHGGDLVANEGGTGLRKIHKILRFDLSRKDYEVDFDYDPDGSLAVTLKFAITGLTA